MRDTNPYDQSIDVLQAQPSELLDSKHKLAATKAAATIISLTQNAEYGADIQQAIKDMQAYSDQMEEKALIDSLTKLPNRTGFFEHTNTAVADKQRTVFDERGSFATFAFFVADLNKLKLINDECGHDKGDLAIQLAGETLRSVAKRPTDIFARTGGDEFFGFMIPSENALSDIINFAELARNTFDRTIEEKRVYSEYEFLNEVDCSMSLGASLHQVSNQQSDYTEEIKIGIKSADQAQMQAKNASSNVSGSTFAYM